MKTLSTVVALAILLSQNAFGIDYPAKGQNYIVCEASTLVLEEGHSLTLIKARGFGTVTNPPSHVECYGTVESMPDKSFKASGYCVHTDRDGDKISEVAPTAGGPILPCRKASGRTLESAGNGRAFARAVTMFTPISLRLRNAEA